jgi:secreted trypsin-like serine protease
MRVLWIAILLVVVRSSYQTLYQCNPTAACGCSSKPATVDRIVGGVIAGNATWGWIVLIGLNGDNRCGGSILSGEWILTAAHCVIDLTASQLIVYAGSNIVWSGTQNRTVSQVITHSAYNGDTYVNDIALLQLTSPLDMSDPSLSPICLPSINSTILATSEWPPVNTSVSFFLF